MESICEGRVCREFGCLVTKKTRNLRGGVLWAFRLKGGRAVFLL